MKKPEAKLQEKCIQYAKNEGIFTFNVVGSAYSAIGTPDLFLCIRGKFVACEFKVGNNKLSPAQRLIRDRIIDSGGLHFVPRSFEEFKKIIDSL